MDDVKIDLEKYRELPPTFLQNLSGDKMLTFDILDQNGEVVFRSGEAIQVDAIQKSIAAGSKFFIPRAVEPTTGRYDYEIIPVETMKGIAAETAKTYGAIRSTGVMSYEQYVASHEQFAAIVQGLRQEDKNGGLLSLMREIENFDYYTYVHSVNVGVLAMILMYKLGYNKDEVRTLSTAGYLHDIGKLRVPKDIIEKPGRLSKSEFEAMMDHTRDGFRILDAIVAPGGQKAVPSIIKLTALFHHRKFRNRGYPYRSFRDKKSEQFYLEIPEEVRLISICDMFDAITTSTPYRKGVSHEEGLQFILNLSNYHFTTNDVYRFLKPMIHTLNKGKNILAEGDFIMVESTARSTDDSAKKQLVYEFARVMKLYKGRSLEPHIRIFYDISKKKKIHPIEVDLRHDHYRRIVRILKSDRMLDMMRTVYS
ncbi:MAG TPA: HD domain-containing protein [Spirochaetota bacterium]|nr:HD domain-containing protein [Spirochaetota bacterium]HNT10563.1 HD domain-containing protein [Spirochaetota bacterium]